MKLYDISMEIYKDMVYYADDPIFTLTRVLNMTKGDDFNLSEFSMGTHTGTHIDAPLHFIENGLSIAELPLTQFYGKSKVIDLTHIEFGSQITKDDIKSHNLESNLIVLFKTKNSVIITDSFTENFVNLSLEAARYLVELKIKAVGIDYLSIGSYDTHRILLSHGIIIYEGLVLNQIVPEEYTFIGFPLRLIGGEGSPTRAVLVKE